MTRVESENRIVVAGRIVAAARPKKAVAVRLSDLLSARRRADV